MNVAEKTSEIGAAVIEYQEAKGEAFQIEEKIEKIFYAYREAGATMDSKRGSKTEPVLFEGKVKFGWYASGLSGSDIKSERELAIIIAERDQARKRLREASEKLKALGITGVS